MLFVEGKIDYTTLSRTTTDSGRVYLCPDGSKVPSVTTILDKTKSKEAKEGLEKWRKRVGQAEAAKITRAAAGRGTSMHNLIEKWLIGDDITPGSNQVHQEAHKMANAVIENLIKPSLTEVWGIEAPLYYPQLYAGTTDCVGIWENALAIVDFKQTNKPKKEEWVQDYYLQLAAYMEAHNKVYNTNIKKGVVLMCSGDLILQKFELDEVKLDHYTGKWWDRVEAFYNL